MDVTLVTLYCEEKLDELEKQLQELGPKQVRSCKCCRRFNLLGIFTIKFGPILHVLNVIIKSSNFRNDSITID